MELGDYFPDIVYSFPYKDLVAIMETDREHVYIFDTISETVIKTITVDEMPEFGIVKNEDFSRYKMTSPVFTADGRLIIMTKRFSYLLDPDYNCYD